MWQFGCSHIVLCTNQAVYYLVRTDFFLVGVHASIALDHYGLLRRSPPNTELRMRSATLSRAC